MCLHHCNARLWSKTMFSLTIIDAIKQTIYSYHQKVIKMTFFVVPRDPLQKCYFWLISGVATFCDILRDPPGSPNWRYFISRFFFGLGPHFSRFSTLRVCCDVNIINTLPLLVYHTTTSITFRPCKTCIHSNFVPFLDPQKKGSKTGPKIGPTKIGHVTIVSV